MHPQLTEGFISEECPDLGDANIESKEHDQMGEDARGVFVDIVDEDKEE